MEAVREGELHPLQNPTILGVIFKKLKKLEDLKSCRLVCREWCRGSTEAMKEVPSVVKIRDEDGWRIPDFLELVRVEGEEDAFAVPPFMKDFKFCRVEGGSRTFWEASGAIIKSLDLAWVVFESGDIFRHAIFQCCPNLEALTMLEVRVEDGRNAVEPSEWMPSKFPPNRNLKCLEIRSTTLGGVSWMEILSQFPAVEKFHASYGVSSLPGFFRSLMLARRHDDQCWKIRDLAFNMENIHAPLSRVGPALENLKLPLEKLHVNCVNVTALQDFLAVHAPMLTDLIIFSHDLNGTPMMQLFRLPNNAVFENVTNLKLLLARLNSVVFLQSFPSLKKLHLACFRPQPEFAQEQVGNWILGSCTELEVSMEHLSTEDVRQLLSKLPNLESLIAFSPNNDKFQVICELLPKLEHLEFTNCRVNEIGISGLDEEDVARINEEGPEGDWWPITVARPNLTGLMNVKRFKIDYSCMELGYTTAVCVQQHLNLQELRLEVYGRLHPILKDLQTQLPWTSQ